MVTKKPASAWRRARRPEQKARRRRAILDAAAALLAERDYDAVTMRDVATRAGQAKGNLYRYFASKEELFCQLYRDGIDELCEAAERQLAELRGQGDPDQVAVILAELVATRPRLAALLAILAGVLERRLAPETAAAFKASLLPVLDRLAAALRGALPWLREAQAIRVQHVLHALVAGLWPMANPSPDLARVLANPDLAAFRLAFRPTLEDALRHLLLGLQTEGDPA